MRVVVSGGGSAGHITPALAVSDALRQADSAIELLYVGQSGSMEERIVRASGLSFAAIRAGKFRRDHFASPLAKLMNAGTIGPNVKDGFRTVAGVGDAVRVLRRFKPDVVFIKGGFVGVPVGVAARLLRVPYVIHESDVTPGLANRFLARWAERIGVGFPVRSYTDFEPSKLVYVGNPVRANLVSAHRFEGLAKFKLSEDLPVVLITGGSQGARQINDCVMEALPELLEICQVIHQTGEGEFERLAFERSRRPKLKQAERYHPYAFILQDMNLALAAADVVVGRAGVGTIAESATLGKPTVLIPNYQMAGHQVANARVLSRAGAARVLDGKTLTPAKLVGELKHILSDQTEQERLSKAIKAFSSANAAADMAEVVLGIGQAGESHKQKPNTENHHG